MYTCIHTYRYSKLQKLCHIPTYKHIKCFVSLILSSLHYSVKTRYVFFRTFISRFKVLWLTQIFTVRGIPVHAFYNSMFTFVKIYAICSICIYVYTYIRLHVYTYTHIHVYMYMCIYAFMWVCINVCMYVCMHPYKGNKMGVVHLY